MATTFAQTDDNVLSLLESISQAVRSADSLHVEGLAMRDTIADKEVKQQETTFDITTQVPLHLRMLRGRDKSEKSAMACHVGPIPRSPILTPRSPPPKKAATHLFVRWSNLTEHLVDAKITGNDRSEFEGRLQNCEIVVATYETPKPLMPGVPSAGRLARTFCIDPVRRLILRERLEARRKSALLEQPVTRWRLPIRVWK